MSSYVDLDGISHEWLSSEGELKTLELEMDGYLKELGYVA